MLYHVLMSAAPKVLEVVINDYATVEASPFFVTAYDGGASFNLATVGGFVFSTGVDYNEAVATLHEWIEKRDAEGAVLLAQAAVQGDAE
jgi:hypothetical protein